MTWNYRVVEMNAPTKLKYPYFKIFEVFYNKDGTQGGYAEDFGGLVGESVEDLKGTVELILEAFEKPTLKEEELK